MGESGGENNQNVLHPCITLSMDTFNEEQILKHKRSKNNVTHFLWMYSNLKDRKKAGLYMQLVTVYLEMRAGKLRAFR